MCPALLTRCRRRLRSTLFAPLLLAAVLTTLASLGACDLTVATTTIPPGTAPSALDVKIVISDDRNNDGKAGVVVFMSLNGVGVQFAHGESLSCNGVALPDQSLGFGARVPVPILTTRAYDFDYHHDGTDTDYQWTVSPRDIPDLLQPEEGHTAPRANPLTITYTPAYGSGWSIGATAGTAATSVSSAANTPDTGSVVVNASSLPSGLGYISLVRSLDSDAVNTPFHSLHISYIVASRNFQVTWT
jgi:hypothetical protein